MYNTITITYFLLPEELPAICTYLNPNGCKCCVLFRKYFFIYSNACKFWNLETSNNVSTLWISIVKMCPHQISRLYCTWNPRTYWKDTTKFILTENVKWMNCTHLANEDSKVKKRTPLSKAKVKALCAFTVICIICQYYYNQLLSTDVKMCYLKISRNTSVIYTRRIIPNLISWE